MNYKKWEKEFRLSVLAAKLAEEAGEVSGAIADRALADASVDQMLESNEHILNEIAHTRFFLDLIERKIRIG